ncbi:MAG: alpha-ribazole phosphatase [Bacillus sp. (in: Bacteria)]|uniref:Alpha-ribazole phosphatase n=1 Tax=Niallia alba TaxID=2729105 RepID=A0A7Y0K837_9BACI|nr:alpha-ribazole phosphatase [Niallia alba]MBQ6447400.1 alpha-ribazole phosphatase [Bacillus sp. (in: firmicutes)]NMO77541.1 alpha-ribazole phosphatase [Niallia alba]
MKFYLIRHGQTEWNVDGKIQGSTDIELNTEGLIQAAQLSEKIQNLNYPFSKIYSSPQQRAVQTAEILSRETAIDYEVKDGLEEINLGEWEGLSWREVQDTYPQEFDQWLKNRKYTKPPKGESYQEMIDRVLSALNKILRETNEDAVIVTHSAVIMCLQCYLTNTPFEEMTKFKTENSSITEIDAELLRV